MYDTAVSEIVGALVLISVLVTAFGIFGALYIPTLIPDKIPQVKMSMACDENDDPDDMEYPCTRGSFNCRPYPFDNKTCEEDCKWRDYSVNPDITSEQIEQEISKCLENCNPNQFCSDLSKCKNLYICHNSGNSLKISDISIIVNGNRIISDGNPIGSTNWEIKEYDSNNDKFQTPTPETAFNAGDSIRIRNPSPGSPVDTVMVVCSLPSGTQVTLAMNQFGTDVR